MIIKKFDKEDEEKLAFTTLKEQVENDFKKLEEQKKMLKNYFINNVIDKKSFFSVSCQNLFFIFSKIEESYSEFLAYQTISPTFEDLKNQFFKIYEQLNKRLNLGVELCLLIKNFLFTANGILLKIDLVMGK